MMNFENLIVNFAEVKDDLGGHLEPTEINDAGEICGPYVDNFNDYQGQAFLLVPLAPLE